MNTVETWRQNITEHKFLDFLAGVLGDRDEAAVERKLRTRAGKELIDDRRVAEASPLWWALKTLSLKTPCWRNAGGFAVAGMLSLLGLVAWWRIGV